MNATAYSYMQSLINTEVNIDWIVVETTDPFLKYQTGVSRMMACFSRIKFRSVQLSVEVSEQSDTHESLMELVEPMELYRSFHTKSSP